MSTALREAALAAVAARLTTALPDAVVERARRAPVDTDSDALPRLILRGEAWQADTSQEPGQTHYSIGFVITGFIRAGSDLAGEQALSDLHARIVAALAGWTPDTPSLGDVVEQDADFLLYDAEDSAKPAGEVVARFALLAIPPTGSPYTP